MTDRQLVVLATFSVLVLMLLLAPFVERPVSQEALAAFFALLGAALAYAFATNKDDPGE